MNEELRLIISAEIEQLKQELAKAQKEIKNFQQQGESAGSKFGKAMGTMGKAAGAAFKAVSVAIAAGAAALVGLAESTREYRTEQAKLIAAFETAGGSAEQAKETYNDLYRVLGDTGQATEAANLLAKMTTNEKELAEWTKICQGAYATFGDSMPIESLAEAANETAKTGEITGALADALNWAGVSEDAFAEELFLCNSEAERERLIRYTLNGLYGEAAENYETTAASLLAANEAQAKLTESLAALGAVTEPIITLFKNELAGILQELVPHFQTFATGLNEVVNGVEGGAAKMSEGIQGLITTILDVIVKLLPSLLNIGTEIIAALLDGIVTSFPTINDTLIELLPQIITTIGEFIPRITVALHENLPLILDAVIKSVAQVIVVLGDILPEIIVQIVKVIPQLVNTLIDNIPVLTEAAFTFFMAIVKALPQIIPALIVAIVELVKAVKVNLRDKLAETFANIWDNIVKVFKDTGAWFGNIFKGAFTNIKNAFSGIANFFSGIWNSIVKIFSKVGEVVGKAITNTVKAAVNAVLSTAVNIINGFIGAINAAISVINLIPNVNISKINKLSVPKLEKGGVLKKGQIGLLEGNGAEAVVPLEKNTEWLDKIAARLNNATGSNKEIILQVDGKTFAKTAVTTINNLTRQQGKLPLVLA